MSASTMPAAALPGSLGLSVLVLNRSFVAVHITNVRRAITLLFRHLAEVVHIEEGQYAAYSLDSWRELSALRAGFSSPEHDWVKAVGLLRPWAAAGAQIQPEERVCPGWQPVPVLRTELPDQRVVA